MSPRTALSDYGFVAHKCYCISMLHSNSDELTNFPAHTRSITPLAMAINLDREFLKKVRVRVIIGLLHEELLCRRCGARWRVGEPLPADYWRCPNGCNRDRAADRRDPDRKS
jgi:hypothetical protein